MPLLLASVLLMLSLSSGHAAAEDSAPSDNQGCCTTPHSEHVSAEEWLSRLETRSKAIKTMSAALVYDRIQGLTGNKQRRLGDVVYEAGPPARFAIHFASVIADRRQTVLNKHYIFDGQWLVDRDNEEKTFIKRQLVPPDAHAEETDPLRLGRGPFPLPIRLDQAEILKRFTVSLMPPQEDDPTSSVHLRLTPRSGRRVEFTRLDLWYDRQSLLPQRLETNNEDDETRMVVTLDEVQVNQDIDPLRLDTTEPTETGWRVEIKPYEE